MKRFIFALMSLLIISLALFSGCGETTPITKNLNLVNEIIDIPAEGYYNVPFSVDVDTMQGVIVEGKIEVAQGTGVELDRVGNTYIDFLILDDNMFTTWANTNLYYLSDGRLHLAQDGLSLQWYEDAVYEDSFHMLDLYPRLPGVEITTSGDYHLVFSNRGSPFISKIVTTKIDLNWAE